MGPDEPHAVPHAPAQESAVPEGSPALPAVQAVAGMAVPRPLAVACLLVLAGFIGYQGWVLYAEWAALQGELESSRQSVIVGFLDISPNPNYARYPANWVHDEGEQTLLWAGWKPGTGHDWFRFPKGEVDLRKISTPFGRDVIRSIDHPIVESGGGPLWDRVPLGSQVVGLEVGGVRLVYPIRVLDKVEAINHLIEDLPILVTYSPFAPEAEAVSIFDATLEGERVTMGLAGYFQDRKPVLYDRGTQSLWVEQDRTLRAFAGPHKGAGLKLIDKPVPMTWGDWLGRYPDSQLVVGADRSKAAPAR